MRPYGWQKAPWESERQIEVPSRTREKREGDRVMEEQLAVCGHLRLKPEVVDQTLGVLCQDCGELLGVCWQEEHVSEELWNRACRSDGMAIPCNENRSHVCALCASVFDNSV